MCDQGMISGMEGKKAQLQNEINRMETGILETGMTV